MKKRVAVIAREKVYAEFLMHYICRYMSRYADFISYSIPETEEKGRILEDVVLLSAFNIFQLTWNRIGSNTEVVVLAMTLSKKQIKSLEKVPKGIRALLVNYDERTCLHTISCLREGGFTGIDLVPYWGEGDYDPSITTAITPNEAHLVPPRIKNVYDIGESAVDLNSMYTLADKLGVYEEFSDNEARVARNDYIALNSSVDRLMNRHVETKSKLGTLLKLMKDGIIITDSTGTVYAANIRAEQFLAARSRVLQGFAIKDILPELKLNSRREQILQIRGLTLIAVVAEVRSGEQFAGWIITLTDFEEGEERQHIARSKQSETSHAARYHFDDILGESAAIRRAIALAKEFAVSGSSVMIYGESGTGKEMFAQSIHNASPRRKYNFVAVNCSAIPENLLESEMFGYEDGAFTGARKGGKAGYFELAHRGTIFLDEIGEMPPALQAKLLRALEERAVMRIGSGKYIHVDVRVIAATNENLEEMMAQGKFREDLFYRLNVLPLTIPPLRERREDILPVFSFLLKSFDPSVRLTPAAEAALKDAPWRGNVRELRNAAEYLACKRKECIDAGDLPAFLPAGRRREPETVSYGASAYDRFLLREGKDLDLYRAVLEALEASGGRGVGRGRLAEMLEAMKYPYSEGEIRRALERLSEDGYVHCARGRGGSRITGEGSALRIRIAAVRERAARSYMK